MSKNNNGNKKFIKIGCFGFISSIPKNIKQQKIVSSTDGISKKIEIVNMLKKYNTIGIDLVAMCVNDLIDQGAKHLLFVDYISINKINLKKLNIFSVYNAIKDLIENENKLVVAFICSSKDSPK